MWVSQGNNQDTAAAAAESLQLCPTLCDPIDGSPPGSSVPRILQARILEWVAISFCNAWKWKVKMKSLSHVQLLMTPWTVAYQAPPSIGFSRQEYWSGLPFPSPINILGKLFLSGGSMEKMFLCPFQLLEADHILWPMALSVILHSVYTFEIWLKTLELREKSDISLELIFKANPFMQRIDSWRN